MPYNAQGQWVASTQSDQTQPSDFDSQFGQYIPLDLLGSRGRVQAAHDASAAEQNRGYWDTLTPPSQQQLMGPSEDRDAQMSALRQMQQWGQGGLTTADRGSLEMQRGRDLQASGAAQRSLMQQAQARGVGGSGMDFATRQMAGQQGQQQTSDAETQMMQGAQQRALAAVQAQGQMAGSLRSQDVGATQQGFENEATRAAGATGQYGTDVGARQAGRDRQRQSDTSLVGLLASL